jgi:hypothetical protein
MTFSDDNDALRQRAQELERELESSRAGRKEAEAEVERLNAALAEARRELEQLRAGKPAQEPDPRRRRAGLVAVIAAALLVACAAVVLVVSHETPRPAEPVPATSPPSPQPAAARILPETQPDERLVRSIIQQHAAELQGCYEQELQASPSLAGTVMLQLAIDAGRVTPEIASGSTLNNARVESCIVAAASRWSFPRDSRFTFRYPIVFRSK